MATEKHSRAAETGHVGLNVSDLDRSKRFYQEVFGFHVTGESTDVGRRFAFLSEGPKVVLTLWEQSQGRFDTKQPGLHHLSFQVGSIDQVKDVEARLRAMRVPLLYDGIVPHAEGRESGGIFFEDPDGIRLEIYATSGAAGHDAPTPGAPSCGFF